MSTSPSSSSSSKNNIGQRFLDNCKKQGQQIVNNFRQKSANNSSQQELPPNIKKSLENIDNENNKTRTRFNDILKKQNLKRDKYPVMDEILTKYDDKYNEILKGTKLTEGELRGRINELQILSDEFKKEFKKNFDKSTNTYLIFIVIFILLIVFIVSAYYIFRNKKGGKKIKKIYHERVN
jgi:hypothetical protein